MRGISISDARSTLAGLGSNFGHHESFEESAMEKLTVAIRCLGSRKGFLASVLRGFVIYNVRKAFSD